MTRSIASRVSAYLVTLVSAVLLLTSATARAEAEDSAAVEKVTKLNKKAVDEYQNLNFEEARKLLKSAIEICGQSGLENHPVTARTYVHLGIVVFAGFKQRDEAIKYFRKALDYNCHLSVRDPGKEFLYKPNCKVVTAAVCDANLVSTRDESTVELLGPDYPYYADPTVESLTAAIDKARTTFRGPEWKRGLEVMRELKERTRIERIVDDYLAMFAELP